MSWQDDLKSFGANAKTWMDEHPATVKIIIVFVAGLIIGAVFW